MDRSWQMIGRYLVIIYCSTKSYAYNPISNKIRGEGGGISAYKMKRKKSQKKTRRDDTKIEER